MDRISHDIESDLIDLGSATMETKGSSGSAGDEHQRQLPFGGGLSDD